MKPAPDAADKWLSQNDPLHAIQQEAAAHSANALDLHGRQQIESSPEALRMLQDEREEITDNFVG